MKINKLNNKGFTIVETLIVLAIAAVILIIVLLAVPALQRSSKNTSDHEAADDVSSAISDYESANSGSAPAYISSNGTAGTLLVGASSSSNTTYNIPSSDLVLQYAMPPAATSTTAAFKYSTTSTSNGSTLAATGNTISTGNVGVVVGGLCPSPATTTGNANLTITATSAQSFAIVYPIQASSGGNTGCIQS